MKTIADRLDFDAGDRCGIVDEAGDERSRQETQF